MSMMQTMQVAEWAWCKRCKLQNEHDAEGANMGQSCVSSGGHNDIAYDTQ
jgi:hypothetical protein